MVRSTFNVLVFIIALSGTAQANDLKTCIAQAAELDVGNKTAFHNGMRDLIVREAPQFDELAGIYREMQIALAEKRHRQLQYLLFTDPERLVIGETISKLTNYDWDEKDTAIMARVAPDYKALVARIDEIEARNQGHADWPALRAFVAEALSEHAQYKTLMTRLWKGRDAASAHLKSCQGG